MNVAPNTPTRLSSSVALRTTVPSATELRKSYSQEHLGRDKLQAFITNPFDSSAVEPDPMGNDLLKGSPLARTLDLAGSRSSFLGSSCQ